MLNLLAENPAIIHYVGLGATLAIATLGVALGQSKISQATSVALYAQPTAAKDISRISLVSMALCETALILTLSIVFIALFSNGDLTLNVAIGNLLLIGTMGIVASLGGYLSSFPATGSLEAIARQPFFGGNISILMLITTLFVQTPVLFGFLLSIAIRNTAATRSGLDLVPLLASTISFGIGCAGPLIGLARYGYTACRSLGFRRNLYKNIFSFSILSQAMIEAPILFATILSFLLLGTSSTTLSHAVGLAIAGITMGIGTIAPGISSGSMTARALDEIIENPEQYNDVSRASFIAQVFIDTLPLHCLILSLVLVFFT